MSKKSLSDLLREEVHKPQTSTVESSSKSSSKPSEPHELSTPAKSASASRLTKAELEGKVVSLTEALALAQQSVAEQEAALAQHITQLESTVAEQQQSIQQLQVSVDQARSLKSELDLTKKDALKLAQDNERLQRQNQELKTELASAQVSAQVPSQASAQVSPKATPRGKRQVSRSLPPPSRSILERPIKPAQSLIQTGKSSKSFDTWCYD